MASGTETFILQVENTDVEVTRKHVKRMSMRVARDGSVRVSAPMGTPMAMIDAFVRANSAWLATARARAVQRLAALTPADGGTMDVWGVPRTIRVERTQARSRPAFLQDGELVVPLSPAACNAGGIERACADFLAHEVRCALEGGIAERMERRCGVHAQGWRIRSMTSRWGSCQVVKRTITINSQLARYPRHCLEYVVCHELCHLLEPSHNARFHNLMDRFYPGWRAVRKELRG